jgi:hypothetical protein
MVRVFSLRWWGCSHSDGEGVLTQMVIAWAYTYMCVYVCKGVTGQMVKEMISSEQLQHRFVFLVCVSMCVSMC